MSGHFHKLFLLGLVLFVTLKTYSQAKKGIEFISSREQNRILLRWAPLNATDWLQLNEKGYVLSRITIARNDARVYPPEKPVNFIINVEDISKWALAANDNEYAAIAAQAVFGNTFSANIDNARSSVIQAIQISKEQEMRFSYTLLSADLSFEVAQLAGLGFIDKDVVEGETYLYKINGRLSNEISDTTYAYVDKYIPAQLPAIQSLSADFSNKVVQLSWDTENFINVFTSYQVEKSIDGQNFLPLKNNTIAASTTDGSWMFRSDSLDDNNKTYYYRVFGRTPFGQLGPPSNLIQGVGIPDYQISIGIIKGVNAIEGNYLEWQSQDSTEEIEKYLIKRSIDAKEFYILDSVNAQVRSYLDENPLPTNYYIIEGMDGSGRMWSSNSFLVQVEDSLAPDIPKMVVGFADSLGVISLKWQPNAEPDLLGYRVFRSIIKDSEFRQMTNSTITESRYQDSVKLNSPIRSIFYKVLAVDLRGNRSELSQPIKISLPDREPPVAPRIIGFESSKDGTIINFQKGPSLDLAKLMIFKSGHNTPTLLTEIPIASDISSYTDTTKIIGNYNYFIMAVDSSGNHSINSNQVNVDVVSNNEEDISLMAKANRSEGFIALKWDLNFQAYGYYLYRAVNDDPLTLYKRIDISSYGFKDNKVQVNANYRYRIEAILIDQEGVFSEQIEVKY